jgi:hypothetical protein
MSALSRIAFSTLAFPDATLAAASLTGDDPDPEPRQFLELASD